MFIIINLPKSLAMDVLSEIRGGNNNSGSEKLNDFYFLISKAVSIEWKTVHCHTMGN